MCIRDSFWTISQFLDQPSAPGNQFLLISWIFGKVMHFLKVSLNFEKLFCAPGGGGYPPERVVPEQRNKKILDGVRAATFKPLIECLKSIDQDLLKGAVAGEKFSELFFASCKDEELAAYIKSLLA